jgi:hypothetical protein
MLNITTEAMEFALRKYALCRTFGDYDPTRAMIAGCRSPEWVWGIKLAAELAHDQVQATIHLRYES